MTILATAIFFELGLRLLYPLYANYNTEMWRYCAEFKQRSDLLNMGHEHKPNKHGILYGVEVKTNSRGFRADKDYDASKPDNVIRILVLGDSITMGWGVNYKDTYPFILETLLNENSSKTYEVINNRSETCHSVFWL